ncbi:MAG TPA: MMPL family transporter, partial [Solirubrobacter sp.]
GDAAPPTEGAGGAGEGIGIAIALVVLLITFGSLVTAGMPLLTSVFGVGIGLTGIVALSAVADLSSAVVSLAAMLGLAVGIDYALFIISRYRALAQRGMSREAAAGQAVGTAGTAVVFAGLTVIIALAALLVTGVPFMTAMGLAAAGTVAIAVLIAITLVPALLGFAGPRALKGKRTEPADDRRTLGLRWVDFVMRHRLAAIGVVVAATAGLAIPATHLRLGLPDDASKPAGTAQRIGSDLLTKGFGEGFNGQLTIVAELREAAGAKTAANAIGGRLAELDDVAAVAPAQLTPDGRLAIISLTPSSGPSSIATKDLVRTIRDRETTLTRGTGADLSVTGTTAVNIDVVDKMGSALIPYLAVIVVLAFLLLMIAFRSILVPLTAVGGFLLSVAAALGAMVAVFQDGFGAGLIGVSEAAPIVSLIPILTIGILFGLAMDYQVFLVSGMREAHAHGASARDAVRKGFHGSARVVTAAGLIMVSVFAGFILPDDPIVKSIGFALTAGVLIDAFLIRMTLIPALMSLLGERAWWFPRALDRVIPDVDIEGARLAPAAMPQPA